MLDRNNFEDGGKKCNLFIITRVVNDTPVYSSPYNRREPVGSEHARLKLQVNSHAVQLSPDMYLLHTPMVALKRRGVN